MSKPNNLKEFLTKHEVEIPMLQRDYAQGRESQREVADRFLKAIFEVLEKDGGSLHLDFIYGYMEGKNSVKKLILIDGQQRITTLWLLHLYIYARAGRLDENAKKWLGNFSYSSRESSKEFCENLLKNDFYAKGSPKETIYDKASEFVKNGDLDNDPTIKAMIHMLDRIHDKFEGSFESSRVESFKSEVNNKLEEICKVSEDTIRPLQHFLNSGEWKDDSKVFGCLIDRLDEITFDFFDMGQFKLGEELYVKMNARGKQLSDYENLKAGIEEGLKREDEDRERLKNLTKNIDSHWSDYFGGFKEKSLEGVEKEIGRFDERGRNFLHYGAVYFYAKGQETKDIKVRLRHQSIDDIVRQLSSLKKMEVLDRTIGVLSNIENFVEGELKLKGLEDLKSAKFFDSKGGKDDDKDDKDEKDAIGLIGVCYFFLILSYMEHRTLEEIESEVGRRQFYDYLCVGRHLIENHPLDNPSDVASFVGLFGFLAQTGKGSVYEIMRGIDNSSNPFHKNVYALEVRKAGLIAQSRQGGKPWESVLSKTSENHFLIGWVDFLLDFSDESFEGYKDKQEEYGNPDFDRFKRYAELTMGILSDEFLGKGGEQGEESEKDEEDKKKRLNLALFQRAWLSIEDYGFCSTHWFYGNRQKGVYRNREAWNNLLGGKHFRDKKQFESEKHPLYFKAFLEKLNKGVGREITTEALCNAMREMVDEAIGNPSWSQKSWWEQLLIKQEGHFDFVNENKDRFQKACRLRFFDKKQIRINKLNRVDKAQAIKVELLQKTDNIKGVLDLLDYGFYLYCKEKFNLSEEYDKDNKHSEYGASEPMTSRFKLEGHEVYCNSMNCARKRAGEGGHIPESSIIVGEKFYEINLNEGCDVFAEFERVLEEARNDGVLSLAEHKG